MTYEKQVARWRLNPVEPKVEEKAPSDDEKAASKATTKGVAKPAQATVVEVESEPEDSESDEEILAQRAAAKAEKKNEEAKVAS